MWAHNLIKGKRSGSGPRDGTARFAGLSNARSPSIGLSLACSGFIARGNYDGGRTDAALLDLAMAGGMFGASTYRPLQTAFEMTNWGSRGSPLRRLRAPESLKSNHFHDSLRLLLTCASV